jgi:AbrB family looped-hinge helix DNA binding protein
VETFTFQASIDSKGRITIPASVRNKLGLQQGDPVTLSVEESEVIRKEVSRSEAIELINSMDTESFSYSNGVLEVIKK